MLFLNGYGNPRLYFKLKFLEGGKGGVPITHHVEFLNEITYHGENF